MVKKEKILIVLYAYYPFANANTNAMKSYIDELKEKYEVHLLTRNYNRKAPQTENYEGIHIVRYRQPSRLEKFVYELQFIDRTKKRHFLKAFAVSLASCFSSIANKVFMHPEQKAIRNLINKNKYRFVLTTCESFSSSWNALKVQLLGRFHCPWFVYFMDPCSTFIANEGNIALARAEEKIYANASLIFTTEEIYKENLSNEKKKYLSKTIPIPFGNFSLVTKSLTTDIFEKNKINCVYVGSLINEQIRSPKYLFQLINELDDRFCFHMIGNHFSKPIQNLRKEFLRKEELVRWHGVLPLDECLGIVSNADILINLANRCVNQTPSKVFDYIGSCRPIVNLYSLDNDTSKHYLKAYPVKCNIKEDPSNIARNAEKFISFCSNNAGNKADKTVILQNFRMFQPKTPSIMVERIQMFLGEKHG